MHLSIDELKDKFLSDGNVYWKMYRGQTTGRILGKHLDPNLGLDINGSWEKLISEINRYENGLVNIETISSPNAKRGINIIVKWGDGQMMQSTNSRSSVGSMEQFFKMFAFMNAQAQQQVTVQVQAAEDRINHKYEMMRMQEQIESLVNGPGDSDIDKIGHMIGMAKDILTSPVRMPPVPQPTAVGIAGAEGQQPPPAQQQQKRHPMDYNHLLYHVRRIQLIYPEYPVNKIIEKVADFCETQKEQADMLVNSLMNES